MARLKTVDAVSSGTLITISKAKLHHFSRIAMFSIIVYQEVEGAEKLRDENVRLSSLRL
jgi:hypothetical protein